jgi:hypothetical protein
VTAWRRALRWLALLLLGLPLTALLLLSAVVAWRVPAATALVQQTDTLDTEDVERVLQLARAHDPRRAIPGVVRTLRLSQHEAELLLNHAAARVRPSRWKLAVGADRLQLQASLRLPDNPFGAWLNVELQARQTRGLPQLESVTLGRLPLPVALVEWAIDSAAARYGLGGYRTLAAVAVQQVRLGPQRIELVYAWGPDAPTRVVAALLPEQEQERLRIYATQLAQLTAATPANTPLSLSQLLPPMFALATQRSAAGQDPALENRAALMVLGMVANGVSLAVLLPDRRDELARRPIRLTLSGRRDFPQHFLVSAALAADSGGPLADMIGLYKEMTDARSGSGFSFNDMAANRAGTRLGELAVGDPAKLQQRLSAGLLETDLMPDVSDLPEYMNAGEFRRRFGGPGSPAYQRMMTDIEERLGATPLFR